MEKLDKDSVNAEMVNELLTQGFTLPEAIEFTNSSQTQIITECAIQEMNRLTELSEQIKKELL